ncbi:MAG: hypothetical protein WC822_06930 [Candidatus Paceibacterota bacterium]|jgi:hypothetical protein
MERIVNLTAAYDRRNPDPSENYGVHGVNMLFILKGKLGAVQFLLYTNWQLPHVRKEFEHRTDHYLCEPMPVDIGYHSPNKMWDDQSPISDSCEWLDGKPCYYDGSGLYAEEVYVKMLNGGSDAVWKELESFYVKTFGALE